MRRFLFFAAIALVLSSCAVYTAEYGYGRIRVPEVTGLPETRYAAIVEENKNKSAEARENARKEAEHRAAMKRKADVNEYPENLAELTFPHIYTPLNTNSTEVDGINTIKVLMLILCGLGTSVMWGAIFSLSVSGLGKYTQVASGIFMVMVVGGGIWPVVQGAIVNVADYVTSFWVVVICALYQLFYALIGSRTKNA